MKNILLVEDDKSFGYVLSEYMQLKQYVVSWQKTAASAIEAIQKEIFDLAILDINLKESTGYVVCEIIKKEAPNLPFIFLTARDLKVDQLKGYQLGADEFITKPIDEEILLAKIEAILARKKDSNHPSNKSDYKDVSLYKERRELVIGGKTQQLTERESLLMSIFLTRPGQLTHRNDILKDIWESQDEFSRNSMDVYISRLRKYLSKSQVNIRNIHGKGFILE